MAGRPADERRDYVIYYQYRADLGLRRLRGIDERVAKAVAGRSAVKHNRFVQLSDGTRKINRTLEAKARAMAGIKGYVTNLTACPDGTPSTAQFVIDAYHWLSRSRTVSACQSMTCKPGRSTTTNATPSTQEPLHRRRSFG